MCGICGILHIDPNQPVPPEVLRRMNSVISHRGPDDEGVWTRGNVGFGHTRLSIIDLSPLGRQPMCNEDETVWITFNGEIYNFVELREHLIKKGHTFRSRTDSEVIIHLWEEEGVQCLERLRGMFAFALWDDKEKTLFLARDRMGQKPLFYLSSKDRILFGSEIKAILEAPYVTREPDVNAIHHYLSYQSVPSPYCAFKGIRKLPPAHYLLIKEGRGEPKRYWKLSYRDKMSVTGEKALLGLQEEIIDRLREAVQLRLMSDVPLGAFLSGGIDSSIVTALMAGLTNQPVKTFSIGFTHDEYNETQYARVVAQRYATEHHEFMVTPDAESIFPELVWHYNEPFADSSAIPTYYVSKLASEHVKVVLSGDAGDENFAGYPRYMNVDEFAPGNDFFPLLRRWLNREKKWLVFRGSGFKKDLARLLSLTQERLLYYYRITHFHELYKSDLYTDDMKKRVNGILSVDLMLDRYRASDAVDFLDATLDLDFGLYLPDTLMVKVDIASMAHALETRSPFLDHKFIEFVARIPSDLKLNNGIESKYILKRASEAYLPREVIYREKMGFGVPLDHWFRGELKDMVYDILLSKHAIERGYFRKEYIQSILERHQKGENWQVLIWNLLMLELWFLMFIDRTWPEPSRNGVSMGRPGASQSCMA
jgi:asparagine synthase (glutamine-hydrolysing)